MSIETDTFIPAHYPASWSEFVGQQQAVRRLQIAIDSALTRDARLDHVGLFCPEPGIGKTSLAWLVAQSMGRGIRMHSGAVAPSNVHKLFKDMEDGDVLFLDEIHEMAKSGDWLLNYLQDGLIKTAAGRMEEAPNVTIVAATTDKGLLPQPILDRMEICPPLTRYNSEDAARIAGVMSRKVMDVEHHGLQLPDPVTCAAIASAADNSPRYMRRILIALRDLALAGEVDVAAGVYDLTEALEMAGTTPDGLSQDAQRYLLVLKKQFSGGPAGEGRMRSQVKEKGSSLALIEDTLLRKELIQMSSRGRELTQAGDRRAAELAAELAAA